MDTTLPPIVAPLMAAIDAKVTVFFTSASSQVAAALHSPFRIMVTIYVLLWGLATWRGLVVEPLGDAVARLFRVVLIGSLALSAGLYAQRIALTAYATGAELATVVAQPSAPSSSAALLDNALNKGNQIALNYMDRVSSLSLASSIAAVFSAFFVWLFTALIVLYGAAIVTVAKVALGVVLAFGPLFIIFLLFDSTKRLFESWLHQVINFMLLHALVSATINLMFVLLDAQFSRAIVESAVSAKADFSALLALIVTGGACLIVLHHIPGLASALSGGVHVSSLNAIRWANHKTLGPGSVGRRFARAASRQGVAGIRSGSAVLLANLRASRR